jgi:hypothetical protein
MNFNSTHYFVLDVESIGLHGEGYAAAYAVYDLQGQELEAATFACDPQKAQGDAGDRDWVAKNVPAIAINCPSPQEVRRKYEAVLCRLGWYGSQRVLRYVQIAHGLLNQTF